MPRNAVIRVDCWISPRVEIRLPKAGVYINAIYSFLPLAYVQIVLLLLTYSIQPTPTSIPPSPRSNLPLALYLSPPDHAFFKSNWGPLVCFFCSTRSKPNTEPAPLPTKRSSRRKEEVSASAHSLQVPRRKKPLLNQIENQKQIRTHTHTLSLSPYRPESSFPLSSTLIPNTSPRYPGPNQLHKEQGHHSALLQPLFFSAQAELNDRDSARKPQQH